MRNGRLKPHYLFFAAIIIFILLGASNCIPSPVSPTERPPEEPPIIPTTPDISATPIIDSPVLSDEFYEVVSLPPPTDNFTNTVAVFLLDVSTSIADLCEPEFQEWRTQVPEFFITYAHAYHSKERGRNEEFKIGWTTFPTRAEQPFNLNLESLSAFDNYNDWHGRLQNDLIPPSTGLGFADALDNTVEQLSDNEYSGYQKVIFLISETYLDYQRDSTEEVDTEKALITQSLNKIPADWRLYIIQLPCNQANNDYGQNRRLSDTGWWREILQDYAYIHLLDRNDLSTHKSVADALFMHNDDQVLNSLLPWEPQAGQHGWGWIDGNPATWQTDGDTNRLDITAVAINANGFQLNSDGNFPAHLNPFLFTYSHERQNADTGCPNYTWTFHGKDLTEDTIGIFWWQAQYPSPQLIINNVFPSTILSNPQSFGIAATLIGSPNFTACYRGRLNIDNEIHPDRKDINSLHWSEIAYEPSGTNLQFQVAVEIERYSGFPPISQRSDILIRSEQQIEVNFTPVLVEDSIHLACPTCSDSRSITTTVVSMAFDYAAARHYGLASDPVPQLFLLTGKSNDEQSLLDCTQGLNFQSGEAPEHNDKLKWDGLGSLLYAYPIPASIVDNSPSPDPARSIVVQIPQTWLVYCAYTDLLLQWSAEIGGSSVVCSLEQRTCEPKDNLALLSP